MWSPEWFYVEWTAEDLHVARTESGGANIAVLELLIAVMAIRTWAEQLRGKTVMIHSDNAATVRSVEGRRAKHEKMLDMLRKLHFIEAANNIRVVIDWISTKDNRLADDISRGKIESFRFQHWRRHNQLANLVPIQYKRL